MFNCLVLKDGSAAFVSPVGQEKYCRFLMCSEEKHHHFQNISQEKSGKTIRQGVYEPYYIVLPA